MQLANIAARLMKPFANSGNKAAIPQTGTDPARASYETGFTPLNMTPIAAGGVPPSGRDMNGILYDLSNAMMWQQAMGILPYDATVSYPNGAHVTYSGAIYRCLADDTTGIAPDSNASKWTDDVMPKYLASSTMELTSVPSQKIAPIICVTQPHLRVMVWNGTQYVRAPWHQPCQLFFSYDNPATIPGALPVRADVSYQQANYPDLVARLGLSGNGTFTLAEARGEFIRVLDNGRGADVGRTLGSAQGDAIRNITGEHAVGSLNSNDWGIGAFGGMNLGLSNASCSVSASQPQLTSVKEVVRFDASLIVPTAAENRPRNLAYPLWITY